MNQNFVRIVFYSTLFWLLPQHIKAELVGLFFDSNVPQIKFAANDIKEALKLKGHTVEEFQLNALNETYTKSKIVLGLLGNTSITNVLSSQGSTLPSSLGQQSYAYRTTLNPAKSFWVLGGDANGAMYGGLQLAENIKFSSLSGNYSEEQSPTLLHRGIKLNLPWDKNNGTYGRGDDGTFDGTSAQLAIKDVWDSTFWYTWFDEMARNRFNLVSLWSCNPFSALVSVPGYEDATIKNITYFDGTVKIMSIAEKIEFWKKIMAYAKSRGFKFYLFNWNVFTYGATGKYGITDGSEGAIDPDTRNYMYKGMVELLKTYPDFDGFGFSVGENHGTSEFAAKTYGQAFIDYLKTNPTRKLEMIHRFHFGNFDNIVKEFKPLMDAKIDFSFSFKISQAHMYSMTTPKFKINEYNETKAKGYKTYATVRNDDFYYLTWGDPSFARGYIKHMDSLQPTLKGFYMGSDGYNPTRTFFSKQSIHQGKLEVQRQAYTYRLWGYLSYNPNTSDEVFKNYLSVRYPSVSSENLYNAWAKGSRGPQLMTEMVMGDWDLDFHWYPEFNYSGRTNNHDFKTIQEIAEPDVPSASRLCRITTSASNTCGTKISSYKVADSIRTGSLEALRLISTINAPLNSELGVTVNNLRALSTLGLYYSAKIKGSTFLKANKNDSARAHMSDAYCYWKNYITTMDTLFKGMDMQRVSNLPNFHVFDDVVLKEYTDLGGKGIPECKDIVNTFENLRPGMSHFEIYSISRTSLFAGIPQNSTYTLNIYSLEGKKIISKTGLGVKDQPTQISYNLESAKGIYFLELKLKNVAITKKIHFLD